MTHPVYKIEVWEPAGGSALYSFTDNIPSVTYKEIITDGVGYFNFAIPTKIGNSYKYYDIDLHDTVKIWLGYDTISGTANFIGKVDRITGSWSPKQGFLRVISGSSLGAILLSRFKTNKEWVDTDAHDIVDEICTDLSLGAGEVAAETTHVNLAVENKTYFDVLRLISDYWYDAATKIQKDFYVDVSNNLVWKARPIRTVGVSTLTVGDNILNYDVTRDKDNVKNSIQVYGKQARKEPTSGDSWTESLTGWNSTAGTLSLDALHFYTGSFSIQCDRSDGTTLNFYRLHPTIPIKSGTYFKFAMRDMMNSIVSSKVRLWAPDFNNYFETNTSYGSLAWVYNQLPLGSSNEYEATFNPSGIWTKTGSPSWYSVSGVQFIHISSISTTGCQVDTIHYFPIRYSALVTDAASITSYGQRDYETTDDKLNSDSACTKRGNAILTMKKDAPIQIEVTVPGDTNILIGDRIPLTIPAENISAANYDVVTVEQKYMWRGEDQPLFDTKATMLNSANTRETISKDVTRAIINAQRKIRELTRSEMILS